VPGPAPECAGGLEITANTQPGGQVTGTVKNSTAFKLDQVVMFAGTDVTLIGSLDPGEQRTFTMPIVGQRMGGPGAEFQVWGDMGFGNFDNTADIGLWHATMSSAGVNFLTPDALVAAGWTRDFKPEVRVRGRTARPDGRTLVLGRQALDLVTGGAAPVAAHREIVRDPFNRFGPRAGNSSIVRFMLPPGADTTKLVLRGALGPAEFWLDGSWRAAPCEGPNCGAPDGFKCAPGVPCPVPPGLRGGPGGTDVTVPANGVRDGVVYLRLSGPATGGGGVPLILGRAA
jgi:hypothetical protein